MLEQNCAGRLARRLTGPYAAVFAGGCAGTALRAWIGEILPGGAKAWTFAVPWATLAVNLAGSFLLGLLAGLLTSRFRRADPRVRLLLGTGLLGSFTTYGTFAAEVEAATTAQAAAYAAGSIACGLLCAWAGLALGASGGRASGGRGYDKSGRERFCGGRDKNGHGGRLHGQPASEPEYGASP